MPIVFIVDDDISVRESLELLDSDPRAGSQRLSRPQREFLDQTASACSELSCARHFSPRPQRSRIAEARCR